jgi:hypothetical protein
VPKYGAQFWRIYEDTQLELLEGKMGFWKRCVWRTLQDNCGMTYLENRLKQGKQ